MKLLMISTDKKMFERGSEVALRQIEYAKTLGLEELHVIVFAPRTYTEMNIAPNVWVYPTRSFSRWLYPFDAIKLGRFIVEKRRITHITTEDPSLTGMVGVSLKRRFEVDLEIQLHTDIGSPYFTYNAINKIRKAMALSYLPKADRIRVVSDRIKSYLVDSLGIEAAKISVRPIGVDIGKIQGVPVIAGADLHIKYPQFEKIVLMASRLEKEKNIKLALRAWPAVIERFPSAGLLIVGSGREKATLENLARSEDRTSVVGQAGGSGTTSVIFEDWATKETLISYYKSADVFLNTSLFEGYGMTLVEAHAAGCRIVSTDVGVAREVGAEIVGWDAQEIAQKIG